MYYHASPAEGIRQLEPRISNHGIPLIYFSKKRENVLVYLSNAVEKYCRETGFEYSGRWQKTEGKKGFDTSINRLQEQCYVIISNFVYTVDKKGNQRGWGVAEYSTPEKFMGESFTLNVYRRTPAESYAWLMEHLLSLFPNIPEEKLKKFLK